MYKGSCKLYKDGLFLYSHFPYSRDLAWTIDKLARKNIGKLLNNLSRHNCRILMAPEIEAVVSQNGYFILEKPLLPDDLQAIHESKQIFSSDKIAKNDHQFIELVFRPLGPLDFLKVIGYLKKIFNQHQSPNNEYKYNLWPSSIREINNWLSPSFHINFSLWSKCKNIFAKKSGLSNITNLILNRLTDDIKETAFIFAQGRYSLLSFADNGKKFLSPRILGSKAVEFRKQARKSLLIRDHDKPNKARVEIRRFNDNTGIQSLKVLMIVKSIADSLDQIIKLTGVKSFDNLEDVNSKLADKQEAQLVDNTSKPEYQLSSIFPQNLSGQSGREVLRNRFKSSGRAKEIFGDELHAKICEADFTLVG